MLWVRVLIWVALAALAVGVVVVTFSGGTIPQSEEFATDPPETVVPTAVPGRQGGEMAYDRWRPGARSDPERLREPAP